MNASTIVIMMTALDSWPNAELAALNLCLWQAKVSDTNIAFARAVECGFTDPDGSGNISSCHEDLCEALARVINAKVANGTWV